MHGQILCGDFWDGNAAQVLCKQLNYGPPMEIFADTRFGLSYAYLSFTPICSGKEAKLEECQLKELPSPCSTPAGLTCSRVVIDDKGMVQLDGQRVCSTGLSDIEAAALCREGGFAGGVLGEASPDNVSTGFTLTCSTSNLAGCTREVCTGQPAANVDCKGEKRVKLVGSADLTMGTVLFDNGLVCDDNWGLQDAEVVCRELGFSGALKATTHSFFGPVETPLQASQGAFVPYKATEVQCTGEERSLANCILTSKAHCNPKLELAGVMCELEKTRHRAKRSGDDEEETNNEDEEAGQILDPGALAGSLAQKKFDVAGVVGAVDGLAATTSDIVFTALEYFDKKEREHQEYLKERPDEVDLGTAGIEIDLKNDKGFMDVGGEFQAGNAHLKIKEIHDVTPQPSSAEEAFYYPSGIGPMVMNGCYGTDYKPGDPCYNSKSNTTKCLDMMEAAGYIGVGFDATGDYTQAGRRKSLIQRVCAGKGSYQGEDVPDNMNVFGIYDTGCSGKTYTDMAARSEYLRTESKLGNNKDLLNYEKENKGGATHSGGSIGGGNNHESSKNTTTVRNTTSRADASLYKATNETMVYEFTCRIRRYEIFMDEVTPDQLSVSFLKDYMNLPLSFYDVSNQAQQKYLRFIERWGTHYIKSASFGGKFTILRKSIKSAGQTTEEWSEASQRSVAEMFENRASGSSTRFGWQDWKFGVHVSSTDSQNKETNSEAEETSKEESKAYQDRGQHLVDDLIVEGGSQEVASILADKDRSGFKQEFKDWLQSVPQYPKGYDFKFGDLSQLLDINFESLLEENFTPCWRDKNRIDETNEETKETSTHVLFEVKGDDGNMKSERRQCNFKSLADFNEKMERKRLSLKRAIQVYARNKGRSGSELVVKAGGVNCDQKYPDVQRLSYEELINGGIYLVEFDMALPIGNKISHQAKVTISFKASDTVPANGIQDGAQGRWVVNSDSQKLYPGQFGPKVDVDISAKKVFIFGVQFTYDSDDTANTLEWSEIDCEYNKRLFESLNGKCFL